MRRLLTRSGVRGEGLRRGTVDFLKLAAEMGRTGELKLSGDGFVRIALRDEFLGEPTLQVTKPATWGAMQMLFEEPLELSFRDGAERGHFSRIVVRLPGHRFPFFNCQETSFHMLLIDCRPLSSGVLVIDARRNWEGSTSRFTVRSSDRLRHGCYQGRPTRPQQIKLIVQNRNSYP